MVQAIGWGPLLDGVYFFLEQKVINLILPITDKIQG